MVDEVRSGQPFRITVPPLPSRTRRLNRRGLMDSSMPYHAQTQRSRDRHTRKRSGMHDTVHERSENSRRGGLALKKRICNTSQKGLVEGKHRSSIDEVDSAACPCQPFPRSVGCRSWRNGGASEGRMAVRSPLNLATTTLQFIPHSASSHVWENQAACSFLCVAALEPLAWACLRQPRAASMTDDQQRHAGSV